MPRGKEKLSAEKVSTTFIGSAAIRDQALNTMRGLGFEGVEQLPSRQSAGGSIPWRSGHFAGHTREAGVRVVYPRRRHGIGPSWRRAVGSVNYHCLLDG